MEWQIVVALLVAIPVILLPVVLVWYLIGGGIVAVLREKINKAVASRLQMIKVKAH